MKLVAILAVIIAVLGIIACKAGGASPTTSLDTLALPATATATPTPMPTPESTPTVDFLAETRARSNGVVCRSLQQLAREIESGVMVTVSEMLQFISDNIEIGASLSSPEIRDAVPKLRPPLEAGDVSGFTAAVNELNDACEKVGGYD